VYVPSNALLGMGLIIPRVIGAVGGHMAYSGIVGYGIGLAALKPERRMKILRTCFLIAIGLHATWNTLSYWQNPMHSDGVRAFAAGVQFLVGALSFAWLVSAIVKGRQLSPTRAENFATNAVIDGPPPAPQPMRQAPQPIRQAPPAPVVDKQPVPRAMPNDGARFELRIGTRVVSLLEGTQLKERDIIGLEAKHGDGVIGRITTNPKDPSVLGLTNVSTSAWSAKLAKGDVREVPVDKTIKLANGTTIDFGVARAEIRER
jgi:hypothetical protein